jgi:hypothetical protein
MKLVEGAAGLVIGGIVLVLFWSVLGWASSLLPDSGPPEREITCRSGTEVMTISSRVPAVRRAALEAIDGWDCQPTSEEMQAWIEGITGEPYPDEERIRELNEGLRRMADDDL